MKKKLILTFLPILILSVLNLSWIHHVCRMNGDHWGLTVADSGHDQCMHPKPKPAADCCHAPAADPKTDSSACQDGLLSGSRPENCCDFEVHKLNTDSSVLAAKTNLFDFQIIAPQPFDFAGPGLVYSSPFYLANPPTISSPPCRFPLLI